MEEGADTVKKTVIQSVIFSVIVTVCYYAVHIGAGMYQTMTYVPDIVTRYESAHTLQSEVSFGVSSSLTEAQRVLLLAAGSMLVFAGGKLLYLRIKMR
ncbi:hypothetical protein SK3146_06917 [Paenibacillus konkukensis]|uniref:Uncharacterized protein n=1 Tax=Paenibacillus konkukensis TaxID=2020716 RepID=A0ABY4RYX0_9BACL|nr:hypothetical protein [Paenibacillus konkukensis]UQZ87615.1 hypothetical protein SK3146_06917 [Paenibacillus konkukensis]